MKKTKICLFIATFLAVFIVLPNLASADTWCHDFNVNLKVGDSGSEVAALYVAINKEGFETQDVNYAQEKAQNYFGEGLASAVTGFQQKYASEILTPLGLKYGTGFVGKATRAKLNQLYGCATSPPWCYDFNTNLKIGDSGPMGSDVWALQTALNREGFSVPISSESTMFGEITASAVSGFQQKYASEILTPLGLQYGTGFVGSATRAKLNKLYGCGMPTSVSTTPPTTTPPTTTPPICDVQIMCVEGYTIYDTGEKDANGCPIKKCISATGNQPPVISGVSGPTTLKVNETGTWTVKASDPENGTLSYYVIWGDEVLIGLSVSASTYGGTTYGQSATFTHVYNTAGNYNPTFSVTDNQGLSAKTSISVQVGEIVTPSITVLSPNGGEVWQIGSTQTIKWNSSGFLSTAKVDISLRDIENTERFDPYVNYGDMIIAQSVSNNGYYSWTIPEKLGWWQLNISGAPYKIVIRVVDDHDTTDTSDAAFSIVAATTPSITVLSPNGGEVWQIGNAYTIQWAPGNIEVVSVQLLKSGNSVYRWDPPYSFSSINWQIQSSSVFGTLIPGSDYKIRVNYLIAGGTTAFDDSDAAFSIAAAATSQAGNNQTASILNSIKETLDQIQKTLDGLKNQ